MLFFPELRNGFKKCWIRAGTSINHVLKFQEDHACLQGEEAGDRKRWEGGERKRRKKKTKEQSILSNNADTINKSK